MCILKESLYTPHIPLEIPILGLVLLFFYLFSESHVQSGNAFLEFSLFSFILILVSASLAEISFPCVLRSEKTENTFSRVSSITHCGGPGRLYTLAPNLGYDLDARVS